MCRSGAYAPCTYPRICSNCASACFHILGFIPWPGPRAPPFAVIPAQAGIHCAAGILFVSPRNPSVFILSPRCPAPVFSFCHPAARAPRKRQFSRVDADRRIQVIYVVANATQMPAGQWIPACAGMTIEKNLKTKELKNLSSRCLTPGSR